jgi:PTH1 family peptidyl-tRNA hydrolase
MKLIVGLGNPGDKYLKTRHNLGFMTVDHFLKSYESASENHWSFNDKLKSEIAVIDWQPKEGKGERIILAKPQTYMNNSGMAVQLIASYYKVSPNDIWIVYDELDLPLGSMKIRVGGAAAGHHGAESVMEHLGTDKFWRFRMGIGQDRTHNEGRMMTNAEDYVLGNFDGNDKSKMKVLLKHGCAALEHALEKGIEAAMNRYNTK